MQLSRAHEDLLTLELMQIMGVLSDASADLIDDVPEGEAVRRAEAKVNEARTRVRELLAMVREEREAGNTSEPADDENAASESTVTEVRGFERLVEKYRSSLEGG